LSTGPPKTAKFLQSPIAITPNQRRWGGCGHVSVFAGLLHPAATQASLENTKEAVKLIGIRAM
jgi:hypothetical protein